jgi:Uma2 family endonuclease
MVECAINTTEGVKVPDIAAASPQHKQAIIESISLNFAPEICVEVMSFSNTEEEMHEKRDLYFAKGAQEFWLCGEFGQMNFYTRTGQVEKSLLCPQFPANIETP